MNSRKPYAEIDLPGNHTVRIYDHSRLYFGDYHRVILEVICEIPLPHNPENPAAVPGRPLGFAVYRRSLERMAVPSADIAAARTALLAEFRRTSLPYLASADFPAKLIARTLSHKICAKTPYALGSR